MIIRPVRFAVKTVGGAALILAVVVPLAVAASGSAAGTYTVVIDAQGFDPAGNPSLYAHLNFTPVRASWSVCPPNDQGTCVPTGISTIPFLPGPEPAGTTFLASATYQGQTYTLATGPWLGPVQATSPPTLTGDPRVGATIAPVAGTWGGGWGPVNVTDTLGVEACKTQAATGCVTLVRSDCGCYPGNELNAVLDDSLSGDYLFATDQRNSPGPGETIRYTCIPPVTRCSAVGLPPVRPGPTVALSAPIGPIVGPTPRPPAPLAVVLRHAILRHGMALVARVTCRGRCHVSMTIHALGAKRTNVVVHGSRLIGIARRRLGRDRRIVVVLRIDGAHPIAGKTELG